MVQLNNMNSIKLTFVSFLFYTLVNTQTIILLNVLIKKDMIDI
jgi:hypothetical protein